MISQGAEIKRELYKSYLILARHLYQQALPNDTPVLGTRKQRFLVGSLIFIAFTMESFINDFGKMFVSDFNDLEKIDTAKKFILFPKLSSEFPASLIIKSSSHYRDIKKLFEYRNLLAHYKPDFRQRSSREERLLNDINHELVSEIYSASINIIGLFNNHFQIFIEGNDWVSGYPTDIGAGY